jgi:hypothetical protein
MAEADGEGLMSIARAEAKAGQGLMPMAVA